MKRIILYLLLVVPLLVGCKDDAFEAWYGDFETETVALVIQDDLLLVLSIPDSLVQGYMMYTQKEYEQAVEELLGVSSAGVFGSNAKNLQTLRDLTFTLASETLGIDRTMVTDEQRLQTLKMHANVLRKTGFTDTLESLTGLSGGLELLEAVKYCHAYDIGQFVAIETSNDWEALKDYLSQWLKGALLLT